MNEELQEWTHDLIIKELRKEIKSLRLILQSHGEIIEINAELKKENARLRELISEHVDHMTILSHRELCKIMGYKWKGSEE